MACRWISVMSVVRGQYHVAPSISPADAISTEQKGGSGMTIHSISKGGYIHRDLGPGMIEHELGHCRGDAAREIIITGSIERL